MSLSPTTWILAVAPLLFGAVARGEDRAINVMAYNVLYEGGDVAASLRIIESEDPDLLCLTELTSEFQRQFENRLGKRYPYRAFHPQKGTWGSGLASKAKLSRVSVFKQVPHRMPAIEARVMLEGATILASCLHLFPPVAKRNSKDGFLDSIKKNANLRRDQADAIVRRYQDEKHPVILLGDMNEETDGAAMKLFAASGYHNACDTPAAQCGATFPGATSLLPSVWQVDHVLGKGVEFLSARVTKSGGSDHFPISASFRLVTKAPKN